MVFIFFVSALKIRNRDKTHVTKVIAHIIRLVEETPLRNTEVEKNFAIEPNSEEVFAFSLLPERTIEVCLAKMWSNFGVTELDVELKFHGFSMQPPTFFSTNLFTRFDFVNTMRHAKLNPSVTFDKFHQPVKPSDSKIQPLSDRDLFFDGKQIFRLLLTYNLNVQKTNEFSFALHGLTDFLYENPVDDVLIQIFTESKKYVRATGPYPDRVSFSLRFPLIIQTF